MLEGLRVGDKGELIREVSEELTIASLEAGLPAVMGTPAMVLLMELAAAKIMNPYVPEGRMSVGVEVSVQHLAATPMGDQVTARATVMEVAGNLVKFEVEAHDSVQLVGQGTHIRAVIDLERFKQGLEKRKKPGSAS